MKKSINLFMTLTSLILCACSTNDLVDANSIENPISNIDTSTGILSFSTKEDFENALENYNEGNTSITRGVKDFYSAEKLYDNSVQDDARIEKIGFLVPDEKYRRFLNKDLEIIVNDTLYHVTKDGTFFAHKSNAKELHNSICRVKDFVQVSDDVKQLGDVKLKDTFGLWGDSIANPISQEDFFDNDTNDVVIDGRLNTRTGIGDNNGPSREEIEKFPVVGAVKVTLLDKVIRFTPSYMHYKKIDFNSNSRRKLYVSLYRYDYGFAATIGLDIKVMKKLWHGLKWGHVVNWDPGIYYGISSLIIKQSIKEPTFNNFMMGFRDDFQKQWNKFQGDHFFSYASAMKSLTRGIDNKWIPEYNVQPKLSSYSIPIIGEKVDNLFGGNKFSSSIASQLDKFLVKKGVKWFSSMDTSSSGKTMDFFSEDDKAIYTLFCNDITWNGGGYRVHDKFLKYMRTTVFGFSGTIGGKNPNIKPNTFSISEDENVRLPEIFFCEGIVYVRDGDGWIGARIVQEAPDNSLIPHGTFGGRR